MSEEKKMWGVRVPITGYVYVSVEARDAREAIEAALCKDVTVAHIEEWEMHRDVVTGNVFHGVIARADAEPEE